MAARLASAIWYSKSIVMLTFYKLSYDFVEIKWLLNRSLKTSYKIMYKIPEKKDPFYPCGESFYDFSVVDKSKKIIQSYRSA